MTKALHCGWFVLCLALLVSPAAARAQGRANSATEAHRLLNKGVTLAEQSQTAEAEDAFRRAIALDPLLAEAHERYSMLLFANKRYAEGVQLTRQALERMPGNVLLEAQLGMHLYQMKHLPEALELLKRAATLERRFELQYILAQVCMWARDHACAAAGLRNYLASRPGRLTPRDHAVQAQLGAVLVKHGRLGEAESLLGRVLRVKPAYRPARIALAELWLRRSDYTRASAELKRLLNETGSVELRLPLGQAYFGLRRYRDALRQATDYLAAHPASVEALILRGDAALALGEHEPALKDYQRSAVLTGNSPLTNRRIARALFHLRRYADALVRLRRAADDPHVDRPTLVLAIRSAIRAKQRPEALRYAAKLSGSAGAGAGDYYYAGMAHSAAGKFEQAIELYQRALAASPGHAGARTESVRAWSHLARRAAAAGKLEEAVRPLEHALRLDPQSLVTARNLALLHVRLGNGSNALARVEQSLRRAPRDAVLLRLAGRALMLLGRHDEARARQRAAISTLVRRHPLDAARLLVDAAATAVQLDRLGEAQAELERAQRLIPQDGPARALSTAVKRRLARVYILRARELLVRGDGGGAWNMVQRARAASRSLEDADQQLCRTAAALVALVEGKVSDGEALLKTLGRSSSESLAPAYVPAAESLLRALASYRSGVGGMRARAAQRLAGIADGVPPGARPVLNGYAAAAYWNAAVLLFKEGRFGAARSALAQVRRRAGPRISAQELRHNTTIVDYATGKREAALETLSALANKVPLALCNLAIHHRNAGEHSRARELFERCATRGVTFPGLGELIAGARRVFWEQRQ